MASNSNNPGGKFTPPSGREHAPRGKGSTVGGVHSPGQVSKAGGAQAKTKPSPSFKNLSR
jgi:hypothetical protein